MQVLIQVMSWCIGMLSIHKYLIMSLVGCNVFFSLCNGHNKVKPDSSLLGLYAINHYRKHLKGHNPRTVIMNLCFLMTHAPIVSIYKLQYCKFLYYSLTMTDMVSQHHIMACESMT